jgi:hypothetical protein
MNPTEPTPRGHEVRAGVLLAFLRKSPRSWRELVAAGLDPAAIGLAVDTLRADGHCIRLTAGRVELASEPTATPAA